MKSVFIVPVYNEISRFPALLAELCRKDLACSTVLLINNGSTDGCAELIRSSGLPYIDLPQNRGVGYADIVGIEWAIAQNYDIAGTIAGNGKMLPSEMNRLLNPILAGEADLVTGSRFLKGGDFPNLPRFRQLTIPLVNFLVWLMTRARLTDATCGYRTFRLSLLDRATFDWRAAWLYSYAFEYYLYAKVILDKNIRWREVPVTMCYPAKGQKYSKIRPGFDWFAMLKPWVIARIDGKGFRPPEIV